MKRPDNPPFFILYYNFRKYARSTFGRFDSSKNQLQYKAPAGRDKGSQPF